MEKTTKKFKPLALLLIITLLSLNFSGCGGGGGGTSIQLTPTTEEPTITTTSIQGAITTTEIGGENLVIKSAHQESAPVASDGTFTTTVSQEGTQVLFVVDSQSNLRGLTLSIINPSSQKYRLLDRIDVLSLDATSTALSLLFLTPGITTIDPTETQARISEFKQLSSFNTLVDFLKTNLLNKSLSDLTKETQLGDLLINVVNDWLTNHPIPRFIIDSKKAGFEVSIKDSSNIANVVLKLSNYGWRYVNVHRRDLDENLNEKQVTRIADGFSSMNGAVPLSWGSIFTGTVNDPTTKEDSVNFSSSSGIQISQYWIVGPGWDESSDTLPSSISDDSLDALGMTIVMYLVFPLIDLIVGAGSSLSSSEVVHFAKVVWESVKSEVNLAKISSSTDILSLSKELINVTKSILSVALTTGVLVSAGIISAKAAVILSAILLITSSIFAVSNAIIAAKYLFSLPHIAKLGVNNKIPTVTISSPSNNSNFTKGQNINFNGSAIDDTGTALSGTSLIWTSNIDGQIGIGTSFIRSDLSIGTHVITLSAIDSDGAKGTKIVTIIISQTTDSKKALKISAGADNTCALLSDGSIKCWGSNIWGRLGNGTDTGPESCSLYSSIFACSKTPVLVSGIDSAINISAGGGHTCALLQDGSIECWGGNFYGQIGNKPGTSANIPVIVSGINSAKNISAGYEHTCTVLQDGSIECWGKNYGGQLGNGTETGPDYCGYAPYTYSSCSKTPVVVSEINSAISISAGGYHTCALLSNGSVKCWGGNYNGQLGNGTTTNSNIPVLISGIDSAISISAGGYHTCALLSNGSVKCWGGNSNGQLGNGTTTNSNIPVLVSGIDSAINISAGFANTCALLQDGSIKCWGYNYNGQLGNGTNTGPESCYTEACSKTPILVSGINNATSISAGYSHTCALLQDGSIECWGGNGGGQLGNGTTTDSNLPVSVVSFE